MNNSPLVSIAVLSYNQEKYIRQTLDSLVGQKHDNFDIEIVVGDDGSKDTTRAIILDYQQQFPGVFNVLPEEPNKGVVKNFRDVLKNCKGKYISVCAGDDYWHDPLKLYKQVTFLENNPDFTLVYTDINCYVDDVQLLVENYNATYSANVKDGFLFDSLIAGEISINSLTVCFRREQFCKYVDIDEFIKAGFSYEDLPTWLELSRHGKFKYLPDSTATYRIIRNSLSHSSDISKKIKFLKAHFLIKQYFIKKYDVDKSLAEQFENYYYSKRFMLAYNSGSYQEALEPYSFLESRGLLTPKTKIRKLLLRMPLLRRTIKFMQSFVKPKELILSQT